MRCVSKGGFLGGSCLLGQLKKKRVTSPGPGPLSMSMFMCASMTPRTGDLRAWADSARSLTLRVAATWMKALEPVHPVLERRALLAPVGKCIVCKGGHACVGRSMEAGAGKVSLKGAEEGCSHQENKICPTSVGHDKPPNGRPPR